MLTYNKKFANTLISTFINEPNNGYWDDYTGKLGNDSNGNAYYFLTQLPPDIPQNIRVISAFLKVVESDSGETSALVGRCSRTKGAWSHNTVWPFTDFDSTVHDDFTFNSANAPDSGNCDGYRTRYKYGKFIYGIITDFVYFNTYRGSSFTDSPYEYMYMSAIHDNYYVHHDWDITNVIKDYVTQGGTGIILWFDTAGANSTKRYLYNQSNSSTYQMELTIEYELLPVLYSPLINTISTVTDTNHSFDWADGTDSNGILTVSNLYYEMQVSLNNGATWGAIKTSNLGESNYTLDFLTYLPISSGQYYYNDRVKIRVRTCGVYNGTTYTSSDDWSTAAVSNVFTVDFRITPTAPSISSIDNSTPYEGQNVNFTVSRPSLYNSKDSSGNTNTLRYYVELLNGIRLGDASEPVTSETKIISCVIPSTAITTIADLSTYVRVKCVDTDGSDTLTSPYSSNVAFTINRFRDPILNVGSIIRAATNITIPFVIQDTGYGNSQLNTQINKIQYKINGGSWIDAVLSTWTNSAVYMPVADTWTYASSTTINVPSGAISKYQVGCNIKLTQNGAVKNCTITAVASTLLTVSGDAIANSSISNIYYSPLVANSFTTYIPVSDAWVYASSTTISVPAGAASIYQIGYGLKFTQGGVLKFCTITNVSDTLLTVTGDAVVNSVVSSIYYSPLISGTRYTLSVQVINNAPVGAGLSNKTSLSPFITTILEYNPKFAVLNDGVYASSIYTGNDYTQTAGPGNILVQNDCNIGGSYKKNGVALAASDVSAVPITRTVNGHALNTDVTVSASDLGLGNVTNNTQVKKITSSIDGRLMKWSGTGGDTPAVDSVTSAQLPIAVNRQDYTTNNTVSNQLIQTGWKYIQGNSTSKITVTVTFPQAYDTVPVVVSSLIGGCKGTELGVPSSDGDFPDTVSSYGAALPQDITATGFTLVLYRSSAWSNNSYYGGNWYAIGTKAR